MGCKEPVSSRAQQPDKPSAAASRSSSLYFYALLVILLLVMLLDRVQAEPSPDDSKIEDIRSSIVESLGLQRIPDPGRANVSQSEYERAHKEYLTRLRRSADGSQQRSLFTMYAQEQVTRDGVQLSFPVSLEKPGAALVESATLRLLLDHEEEDGDDCELEIRVYRTRPISARRRLLAQRTVSRPEEVRRRWLEFDLTDEIAAAAELSSDAPVHLLVQVLRKDQPSGSSTPARGYSILAPALNIHVFYLGDAHSRAKRSLGSSAREQLMSLHRGRRTECKGDARKCCRHRMTVTFKDLEGFDFIIQPKSFDAGYCKGRCPPRYNPAHHHALLQSLIWKEDRKKAPKPCCAPSKLAELEILYFDENDTTKLKVSNWKDMRVIECACS